MSRRQAGYELQTLSRRTTPTTGADGARDSEMPFAYGESDEEAQLPLMRRHRRGSGRVWKKLPIAWLVTVIGIVGLVILSILCLVLSVFKRHESSCDDPMSGYRCEPEISHYLGQYSSFFSVPSAISSDVPPDCEISFVQVLSRHGARDPTTRKSASYHELIGRIKQDVSSFQGNYSFLSSYNYTLGADELTDFGRQQMRNSGGKLYETYRHLASGADLFVRASGQRRVVESARHFSHTFHQLQEADPTRDGSGRRLSPIIVIPETEGSLNTLSRGLCDVFEQGPRGGAVPQRNFLRHFATPITQRLNRDLPGTLLNDNDTVSLMDMCGFDTVASPLGKLSPFCTLFTPEEWRDYDYYQTLGKYYSFGPGHPLGATQGVGFVAELLARLTRTPVAPVANVNTTLDADPATFPLDRGMYADFSHDNEMVSILTALGLYSSSSGGGDSRAPGGIPVATLPTDRRVEPDGAAAGFAVSWMVPFAARIYVEKMTCRAADHYVRVLVNDRVMPQRRCNSDALGRCTLDSFVRSLDWVTQGGGWEACFERTLDRDEQ